MTRRKSSVCYYYLRQKGYGFAFVCLSVIVTTQNVVDTSDYILAVIRTDDAIKNTDDVSITIKAGRKWRI